MTDARHRPIRVLFVCTGNSARSDDGRGAAADHGRRRLRGLSAPARSRAASTRCTLRVLDEAGIDASLGALEVGRRSSSASGSTTSSRVCDEARQICPVFPGVHESLHWGYEDPAEAEGTEDERLAVFRRVFIAARRADRDRSSRSHSERMSAVERCADRRSTCSATPTPATRTAWTRPDERPSAVGQGRAQAERLGAFLAGVGFQPDAIITSPKVRAARTAEIVAERLGSRSVVDERLAGSVRASATLEAILADAGDPDAAGHRGPRSGLQRARWRSCRGAASMSMRKGAFARIEVDRPLAAGAGHAALAGPAGPAQAGALTAGPPTLP